MDQKESQDMALYDSLRDLQRSVEALGELRDLLPEEDRYSALFGCLVEKVEAGFTSVHLSAVKVLSRGGKSSI